MKKTGLILSLLVAAQATGVQAQSNAANEARVVQLLNSMTLEEKVGQMAQVSIESLGSVQGKTFSFDKAKLHDVVVNYKVGSILNTPGPWLGTKEWNALLTEIHQAALKTRLKIPVIYGLDNIHGVNYVNGSTLFPQQIGQAATWNRQLVFNGAAISAYESRAAGVPWTFSPVLDLGTNPMWPRIWEGYGEDPYLISELGVQFVKGTQEPLGSKEKVAVSLKHFLAYSDPKSGKDRTDAWIPEHYLREYHLPPFRAALQAGARNVMVNSALINGVPTHINKRILTDLLKEELGFTGFVVTDWQDIENVQRRDHIVKTNKEAIMLAINAGIDMAMIPYDYKGFCTDLVALVKEGKVSEARINDAVARILRVKGELNLFQTPLTFAKDYPRYGSADFERAAYNTAAESITLLKNTNAILPLAKGTKILVTGPNANTMRPLNGGWSYTWQGEQTDVLAERYNTFVEALRKKMGAANVQFEQGVAYKMSGKYFEDSVVNIDAAVRAAAAVDAVVLCIGENSYTETPGNLNDLNLSDNQLLLAGAMIKTGKPVIVVLTEGRPRIINRIEPGAAAIVHTYLPGNFGGDALADVLAGDVNPSGKLPITYPRYPNALTNYIHKLSDSPQNPQGGDFNPQYPFGFGLSYTRFEYTGLRIANTSLTENETLSVSITVRNTGGRAGMEVVQLYVSDLYASLAPDEKRLRGFEKITLQPGEAKTIEFKVSVKELAFVNTDNKRQVEAGEFKVQVGELTQDFEVKTSLIF